MTRSRQLTVIAIDRRAGARRPASSRGPGYAPNQVEDVVRAAERAAAEATPAEDAAPLAGADDHGPFGPIT